MSCLLKQIKNWPERARKAKWSAATVAQHCGVSARQLHRHFLKHMGKNPKTWLAEQRLQYAIGLLREGFSIKQVANDLGYQRQSNFARYFKNQLGICPSQQSLLSTPLEQWSARE